MNLHYDICCICKHIIFPLYLQKQTFYFYHMRSINADCVSDCVQMFDSLRNMIGDGSTTDSTGSHSCIFDPDLAQHKILQDWLLMAVIGPEWSWRCCLLLLFFSARSMAATLLSSDCVTKTLNNMDLSDPDEVSNMVESMLCAMTALLRVCPFFPFIVLVHNDRDFWTDVMRIIMYSIALRMAQQQQWQPEHEFDDSGSIQHVPPAVAVG